MHAALLTEPCGYIILLKLKVCALLYIGQKTLNLVLQTVWFTEMSFGHNAELQHTLFKGFMKGASSQKREGVSSVC